MKLLPEYFIESFQNHGGNLALFCNNERYTYNDLGNLVANYQKEFAERNFNHQNFVGVITGQDVHTYAAIIALVMSGIPYIPINRHNPYDRFKEIIEESEISVMLYCDLPLQISKHSYDIKAAGLCSIDLTSVETGDDCDVFVNEIDADSFAYMLFTSGSTGRPKGVLVKHVNLAHFITLYFDKSQYDLSSDDRFLQMFDWTFDLAGMMTFIPLSMGASCFVVPEEGIKYYNIISILLDHDITVSMLVPSTLLYIKPYIKELQLPALRYSMFCGEPLLHELMVEWSSCLSEDAIIQNIYGPSECPGASSMYVWSNDESFSQAVNGVVPIGKPVPGMEFYILDQDHNILSPGEKGIIALCSKQVTDGYWKDEEKTKEAYLVLSNGSKAYDTGDIGYLNEEGNYIFLGRKDFQLKLDGYRVEPGEVEHVVRNFLGAHAKVAFIAVKNHKGLLTPHLLVENLNIGVEKLISHLESKLPSYMIPHDVHNVERFPRNANGKADRKELHNLLVSIIA
ncbi:MAG: AMP-binding protein [Chitinophagales bacterium]|nr:AMP-binding protein [Chitinophagales bacterium]